MSTVIRPELSKKNKYWISKHRFYELKHFCLQYPEWKELYRHSISYGGSNDFLDSGSVEWSDRTCKDAIRREALLKKIRLVEQVAEETDLELAEYILKAVTQDVSYTYLRMKLDMPCGRDRYFERYRRFFFLLDSQQKLPL